MGRIQVHCKGIIPGQLALIAQNILRQHTQQASQHDRQTGHGFLGRASTANIVVVNDFAFAGQAHMIIHEFPRTDHLRGQKLRRLPTLTNCEFFSLLTSLFRV